MQTTKSSTDFYVGLYESLILGDMVQRYVSPVDGANLKQFRRDFDTLKSRVKNEGDSFLTKTLPVLAKALDKALVDGRFTNPRQFKRKPGTKIPAFLQVIFERVFETDGTLKSGLSVDAVRDLRQILYLLYKREDNYDQKVTNKFLRNFKEVDSSLGKTPFESTEELPRSRTILARSRFLLHALLRTWGIDDTLYTPKHGPGAVATGEKPWEKMFFRRKYDDLHQVFPYYRFFFANAMDLAANVNEYRNLKPLKHGCAKVVLVPKDSRGPRLISMEPLEYQWCQQAVSRALVEHIEAHKLTRGRVNFTDQEINRKLALKGSMSSDIVTLDMKEASDRISLWLVRSLFSDLPVWPYLKATRTPVTICPNGDRITMNKFAPMGSALCFPVESLVHWALGVATLCVCGKMTLKRALRAVYVFGDDIVIKGENHMPLIREFPAFGLRFNEGKCCTSGPFRESCGMDAVNGESVTITKIKKHFPVKTKDSSGYVSWLAYANSLADATYYHLSTYIGNALKRVFKKIPNVKEDSDTPGFTNRVLMQGSDLSSFKKRFNAQLQRIEYYVRQVTAPKIKRDNDRYEYFRKLVTHSPEFMAGIYSVPRRVTARKGWSADLV